LLWKPSLKEVLWHAHM